MAHEQAQKVAYAVMIPNTDNLFLGTGVYVDTLASHITGASNSIINAITDNINATLIKAFIISVVCFFVIVAPILWMLYANLVSSVRVLQSNLRNFFRFINNNSTNVALITLDSKDEFGAMAKEINTNIQNIEEGLKQDSQAIAQSAETAKAVEDGDLTARIVENPHNPQLIELKNVLNNMLDV
ncbi:MAG: chemotaxis protein, partial [Helicobacter sp.]|nr:chemotaxis protein [Helicobacter sp.]MDY2585302.1 chemotaxis protein [Helicobacter sp.]